MNKTLTFLNDNYKELLVSLFLAILLWIAVTTDKNYTTRLETPFKISRVAEGYVLSSLPPKKMVLEVSGKGRALFSLYFIKTSITLELPEIDHSATINLQDYQQRFNIARELGVHIVDIVEPKSIKLKVDRFMEIKKPVRILSRITTQPGYVAMGLTLDPDSVLVSGPRGLIKDIQYIYTDSIIKSDVQYPFKARVNLIEPKRGITRLQPEKVKVHFNIEEIVERTIYNIPIQLVGIPPEFLASAIPPNVTIRVRGGESEVAALNAGQVTALFNYQNRYEQGKMIYSVDVETPGGITLLETLPASFRLQLKRREDAK